MNSNLVIHITSLSSTGEGIGAYHGLKIFVDGALPGETVSVKIVQKKKNYAIGKLLSILIPSYERTEPHCPLFGQCGGCQVMHLQYPAQLQLKRKRVIDALTRIGHMEQLNVLPCLPSPTSLGYRNKIQLPVVWNKGKKTLGLYRKKTHEIIPLSQCMIQSPQGEEILSLISEKLMIPSVHYILIRNAVFLEEVLVIFVTDGRFSKELKQFAHELMDENSLIKGVVENLNRSNDNVILGSNFRLLAGRPYIYEKLLDKTFKISPSAFFQINPGQTERLYEKAIALADIQPNETILDAYCGVGTLALFAATSAKKVFGIECIADAIADANENARLNQITNCTFLTGNAEAMIHQLDTKFDLIFLNPPRKGCHPELIATLLKQEPKKIIYISCDPATLARDLSLLGEKYHPQTIQPLDMFPQTMHVETIVLLKKISY